MPEFIVPGTVSSLTAKKFLRQYCGISLSLWRKIKQTGSMKRSGIPLLPNDIVISHDAIQVTWELTCKIPPTPIPLSIAFEDDYLIVIDKPAGMLVHPTVAQETDTLANAIRNHYIISHLSLDFHPVHRLDRNTSGLILIAKRPDVQHQLMNAKQSIHRIYWAICQGLPHQAVGTIDAPIDRCPDSIIQRCITPSGQSAITHYRLIQKLQDACLLELELGTGRTHQIRVHLASRGLPLLGDDLYGGSVTRIQRQALHAVRLEFQHPITKENLSISSSLPEDFQNLIHQLSLRKCGLVSAP